MVPESSEVLLRTSLVDLSKGIRKSATYHTTTTNIKARLVRKTHLLDLRRRQLKRHGAQVIAEPLLFARRRDRHDVLVDAPAQADLTRIDGVFLRQLREDVVDGAAGGFRHGGLGAVGGEGDVLYLCVCVS